MAELMKKLCMYLTGGLLVYLWFIIGTMYKMYKDIDACPNVNWYILTIITLVISAAFVVLFHEIECTDGI